MNASYLSVIVPARNAGQTLPDCLDGLRNQSLGSDRYEVIVVDDGSTDETRAIAAAGAGRVISQPPTGPAAARNAGALAARGELLVFTDADCAPSPGFLEQLSAALQDGEVVGAKGAYRTLQRGLVSRFVQQEYQHKYDRMARQPKIDFIDTYAAAYRRSVFLDNGGFDVAYPTACVEDQEFSFRLAEKGYRLAFAPTATVFHRHDRSVAEYVRRKYGIGYWKAFLLHRHPDRIMSDSHTPLTQRLQLVLTPLTLILLTLSLLRIGVLWGAILAGGLLVATAVPELISIVRRDPAVLAIAPGMILFRALALGIGLAIGAAHSVSGRFGEERAALGLRQMLTKRAIDILVSAVGLVLASPLLALASVAIKLGSRGPVFFVQERVGLGGRRFRMIKLRTMVCDAESRLDAVIAGSALQGPAFKIPDDPRVTPIGRWLRRWSVDELPQLWNVLRGDMSLVGPRPEEVRVVAQYTDWHRRRLVVPPGLTGPMQVAGRGSLDLDARVQLELDYIEHYSIWRDLAILARTLPAVISGDGAV
jgi:lipopolysaccharide/colanic/teichoic acid biosynthesis glycosyltransferase/glycosyltransferase involved in cell wall biosynthesis